MRQQRTSLLNLLKSVRNENAPAASSIPIPQPKDRAALRSGGLAQPIDRGMADMGDRGRAVRQHHRIDVDEAVALLLVIAGDPRPHRQSVTDMRYCEMLDPAAGMHPGAEHDIAA